MLFRQRPSGNYFTKCQKIDWSGKLFFAESKKIYVCPVFYFFHYSSPRLCAL